jgi:hypothetical protein
VDTDIGGVPYRIHYFTEVGTDTFTVTNPGEVEYLIVAGGGGGAGSTEGGGGGAGGFLTGFTTVNPQAYTITVGNGGNPSTDRSSADNGGNSEFSSIATAIGGGGGGATGTPGGGEDGGSGGGGGGTGGGFTDNNGGSGVAGQGNDGGFGRQNSAGGGGGAGEPGANAPKSNYAGRGGSGLTSSITGISTFYAGGGGGAGDNNPLGGLGGGGSGQETSPGIDAVNNTGGGGGGSNGGAGGSGGSGIVIIRYPRNASTDTAPDETRPSFQPYNYARDVRPIIARDGLVLDLDAANTLSYSGTGNIWTDISSSGNDVDFEEGVTYTSSNLGAFVFDGSTTYARRVTFNNVPFGYYLTISIWIRAENIGGDTRRLVCQARRSATTDGEYLYGINSNGTQNYWDFNNQNGGYGFQTNTQSATALENGKYYHLVFTKNQETGTFYLNGEFDGTVTATGPAGGLVEFVDDDFVIGADFRNTIDDLFGGEIFKVTLYNRTLSPQEVKQNFNALRGRYGI